LVSFVFSANQKAIVICTRVTSLHSCYTFCTRVTEELHSFLSQSELSNFFVYIITNRIDVTESSGRSLTPCRLTSSGFKTGCIEVNGNTENNRVSCKRCPLLFLVASGRVRHKCALVYGIPLY